MSLTKIPYKKIEECETNEQFDNMIDDKLKEMGTDRDNVHCYFDHSDEGFILSTEEVTGNEIVYLSDKYVGLS